MTRKKIDRISLLLVVLGFGTAAAIYACAAPVAVDPLTGDPLENKKYVHELALYGGKVNVMSAEFMDWFGSLWHGPRLAFTVAALTVGATLFFRFVALHPGNLTSAAPAPGAGPGRGPP